MFTSLFHVDQPRYETGIVIVLGGQYFSWNKGLAAGFWSFFIGTLLIALAYLTMVCSLAEMASVLPFAGE